MTPLQRVQEKFSGQIIETHAFRGDETAIIRPSNSSPTLNQPGFNPNEFLGNLVNAFLPFYAVKTQAADMAYAQGWGNTPQGKLSLSSIVKYEIHLLPSTT